MHGYLISSLKRSILRCFSCCALYVVLSLSRSRSLLLRSPSSPRLTSGKRRRPGHGRTDDKRTSIVRRMRIRTAKISTYLKRLTLTPRAWTRLLICSIARELALRFYACKKFGPAARFPTGGVKSYLKERVSLCSNIHSEKNRHFIAETSHSFRAYSAGRQSERGGEREGERERESERAESEERRGEERSRARVERTRTDGRTDGRRRRRR